MRTLILAIAAIAGAAMSPAHAQIREVDPSAATEGGIVAGERGYAAGGAPQSADLPPPPAAAEASGDEPAPGNAADASAASTAPVASGTAGKQATYKKDDLIGAAEGVFGKGAAGLAGILERILKDQGEPNGYIIGREASGAIGVGFRYGSGTLMHKVEGERPVYWTGPSIGFDLGGDATKVFTLVYNLYDSQDLYKRYPQVEGRLYYVGGFSATYLRRGDVVLIPVRLGVGLRLGANIGYMKFRDKANWVPF